MRSLFITLTFFICLFASAQKKDSTPVKVDTIFILTIQDMEVIKNILMESKVVVNNEQLTGKQLNELFAWMESKAQVVKREQPKK